MLQRAYEGGSGMKPMPYSLIYIGSEVRLEVFEADSDWYMGWNIDYPDSTGQLHTYNETPGYTLTII